MPRMFAFGLMVLALEMLVPTAVASMAMLLVVVTTARTRTRYQVRWNPLRQGAQILSNIHSGGKGKGGDNHRHLLHVV